MLPVVVFVALAVGGCGASSGTPDFVAKANAICASAHRQIAAIAPPATGSSAQDIAASARGVPVLALMLRRLDGLSAPAKQEARFSAMLAGERQSLAITRQMLAAVATLKQPGFRLHKSRRTTERLFGAVGRAAEFSTRIGPRISEDARSLGLTQCG